jgi:hypothetical protein
MSMPQPNLTFSTQVTPDGRIDLAVPLPPGSEVRVLVVQRTGTGNGEDLIRDFTTASLTSMSFWDNPQDDEDWNDAATG